jgi:2-phosphosulfolactate phosphatase
VLFTSLNGGAVTAAAEDAPELLVGSLRNATATAATAARRLTDGGGARTGDDGRGARTGDEGAVRRVTVVACGERWSSVAAGERGWRPALEDWVGAGLICARLADHGLRLSVEASAAADSWHGPEMLADCVSARELRAGGFDEDVALALEVDVSERVPVRVEGRLLANGHLSREYRAK